MGFIFLFYLYLVQIPWYGISRFHWELEYPFRICVRNEKPFRYHIFICKRL